ncbi:MAG: dihydroorotate dehydrogenase electron transfer subunit [Euryarchaeota archaeon]|nr:dihydroorotate dehydrogenase electron transfer subunit [Euryarchaeota archaeon]
MMRVARVKEVVRETPRIKTVFLDAEVKAEPGQFVMLWLPGVDEKPMSIAYPGEDVGITFLVHGPFTTSLARAGPGDLVGFRGPFGRGFELEGRRILLVGGGVGMPPLAALADRAKEEGTDVTAIVGAGTKEELLFVDRMEGAGARVLVATDDGSAGRKGFATDVMEDLLAEESFDACYTCGPEVMMVKVLELARRAKMPVQLSLERYMKCGFGICGHCAMDRTGARVCKEGPVFTGEEVAELTEFGKYRRDAAGARIPLQ